MNIVQTIQKRHSVRTYTGEPLRDEHIAQIKDYINQLQMPFGAKARVELLRANVGDEPVKLGTYGMIKGATDFLALLYEEDPFVETAAAYLFEQVVLFCTHLGLGTVWLATFNHSNFKKQIPLKPNENLRIVSPVGYVSDQKSFIEKYLLRSKRSNLNRKPFEVLFFENDFNHPLTEQTAGRFCTPLQMVRLAPSANNKQEWRIVLQEKSLHIYKKPYPMFDAIDMGIALCHLELSCKALGIEGEYQVLDNHPKNDQLKYVISWMRG
jgi:nitroreductase